MISVIIPVYKVEKYLRKCVESVMNQTYTDLEIILVDDGSPDSCGEICEELAHRDSRIRVIHQKNAGQSVARNVGLDQARGEYIGFIDGDDFAEPDMYYTLLDSIQKHGANLAICGHRKIYEDTPEIKRTEENHMTVLDADGLWQEVFSRLNNAAWNKLYQRDLLDGIRFRPEQNHGEDLLFNLEYIQKCNRAVINTACCYNYLQRSGSVTSSGFSEKKFGEITSKDLARQMVEKVKPELEPTARKYCFRARMNVIRSIYRSGLEENYEPKLTQMDGYIRAQYASVCGALRTKEKVEYFLYTRIRPVYRMVTRR